MDYHKISHNSDTMQTSYGQQVEYRAVLHQQNLYKINFHLCQVSYKVAALTWQEWVISEHNP